MSKLLFVLLLGPPSLDSISILCSVMVRRVEGLASREELVIDRICFGIEGGCPGSHDRDKLSSLDLARSLLHLVESLSDHKHVTPLVCLNDIS